MIETKYLPGLADWSPSLASELGEELHLPSTCPTELRPLVKETLIPLLKGRDNASRITITDLLKSSETDGRKFIPLLENSHGHALAAIIGHEDITEVWWLPIEETDTNFDFNSWIEAAFGKWHIDDPERFPGPPDWTRSADWMTSAELDATAAIDLLQAELESQRSSLQERIDAALREMNEVRARADGSERVLLTGASDDLVSVVSEVLTRLGFEVEDVDRTRGGQQKLEDLRITDRATAWTAIAEVKGFSSGAKPSDLSKAIRFAGLYEGRTGSLPDATWFVVNHFRNNPPSGRRTLMGNHAEDVSGFASDSNGVLIDTKDLFLLDRMVARHEITSDDARKRLMDAKVRFELGGL